MRKKIYRVLGLKLALGVTISLQAQDTSQVTSMYGANGFEWNTSDGNYRMYIGGRLQFRYATPFDRNPISYQALSRSARQEFLVNRARLKIGGHVYKPWVKYAFEYGLVSGRLLDFRIMVEKYRGLNFKIGQWKVNYNRERVVSSGKQQLMDRSIVNAYFTLDRQQGVGVYGNLGSQGIANFSYDVAIVTGAGRSAPFNPTNNLMYIGHLQWNFLGREMPVTESDTRFHQKPVGEIGISGASYKGVYTNFSSSGGTDWINGSDSLLNTYEIRQANVESAFMYKGFSWQNEFHMKWIEDQQNKETIIQSGMYIQAGYFPHGVIGAVPENLEIAGRFAVVLPDIDVDHLQRQYDLAVNYFFRGHRNKLTAEYSWFDYDDSLGETHGKGRFRLQWDISF